MAKNNDPFVPKRPLEAGQQRQEANPTALVDLNSRDPDLLSADYELQLGEGVKQALDFQWGTTGISEYKKYKFAQPGNALGISVVPFVRSCRCVSQQALQHMLPNRCCDPLPPVSSPCRPRRRSSPRVLSRPSTLR